MSTGLSSSSRTQSFLCHCEEVQGTKAIPIKHCARNWMEIAASLHSSQ
jgi:hypothetical protein